MVRMKLFELVLSSRAETNSFLGSEVPRQYGIYIDDHTKHASVDNVWKARRAQRAGCAKQRNEKNHHCSPSSWTIGPTTVICPAWTSCCRWLTSPSVPRLGRLLSSLRGAAALPDDGW